MSNTEVAVFTEHAKQTSHYHLKGSEIYMVLEGLMPIELEGEIYDSGREI
jgi:mannose-6-phosphate isomerase-like protein (cupin superfamily)